jgi:hypothetical protein
MTAGMANAADFSAVNGSGATSGIPTGATRFIGITGFVSAPLAADIIAMGKIAAMATAITFLFISRTSFSELSATFSELGFLSYGGNYSRNQVRRN